MPATHGPSDYPNIHVSHRFNLLHDSYYLLQLSYRYHGSSSTCINSLSFFTPYFPPLLVFDLLFYPFDSLAFSYCFPVSCVSVLSLAATALLHIYIILCYLRPDLHLIFLCL